LELRHAVIDIGQRQRRIVAGHEPRAPCGIRAMQALCLTIRRPSPALPAVAFRQRRCAGYQMPARARQANGVEYRHRQHHGSYLVLLIGELKKQP
jgi:hypothetical protein